MTAQALPPALILILGLLADAALGEMTPVFRRIPHPVVALGRVIAWADRRLNRTERSPGARKTRGVAVAVLIPGSCALLGYGLHRLGWGAEVFAIAILVAQKSLFAHVRDVRKALGAQGLDAGRAQVARIVGRDVTVLDSHGVARAAIESLAENFGDGVVAPVFWYVAAGLPGLMAYKAVNTLDSMIGYRDDRYRAFGWASARLDDLANLIPARLAGLIMALAAIFTPKGNPVRALRTMIADGSKHPSPNSGWPEAAMAGGLDFALGGPRRYAGGIAEGQWIGTGRAQLTPADIDRALLAFFAACLINAGLAVWVLGMVG